MDFANRGNQPAQQSAPNTGGGMMPQLNNNNNGSMKKPSMNKGGVDFGKLSSIFMLVGVSLIAVVLIVGLVFGGKGTKYAKEGELISTDKYQAVFLNSQDGQVYFGKLGIYNPDLYVLTDIYYVRVDNPIQPEGADQAQQANISLAKLGAELHCPDDVMYISRDKVLYWENLQDKGQVVSAIKTYKDSGKAVECNANASTDASTQESTTQETDTTTEDTSSPAGTEETTDTTQTP